MAMYEDIEEILPDDDDVGQGRAWTRHDDDDCNTKTQRSTSTTTTSCPHALASLSPAALSCFDAASHGDGDFDDVEEGLAGRRWRRRGHNGGGACSEERSIRKSKVLPASFRNVSSTHLSVDDDDDDCEEGWRTTAASWMADGGSTGSRDDPGQIGRRPFGSSS